MAPVPMNLPPMAPKLFENLFGMGNQKASSIPQPTAVGMPYNSEASNAVKQLLINCYYFDI